MPAAAACSSCAGSVRDILPDPGGQAGGTHTLGVPSVYREALHTTEVPFAFGRLPGLWELYEAYRGHASYDRRLADATSDYWVSFATSGDPNSTPTAGRSLWRRHTMDGGWYLESGAVIESRRRLRERQYRVLDRLARADREIRR